MYEKRFKRHLSRIKYVTLPNNFDANGKDNSTRQPKRWSWQDNNDN